ncbi:hypothetical protein EMIHUDRAFT_241482 [Emiliania huxleyi CCMP1516]|uniref:Peroxisomal membrane protein PEX16 n=2 Tax=Emiliania huxleyi TaxID=2903 RepID=A0A0D3JCJ1_EMIH1|nr:hypothetical protein EMIHUDRAFT_241482 [Emiliania huxleyi CCMP1516]EOD21226.1 hypothetical protein EMIHUDRAFT_241482 [Emiliania huxleyi CCMP1516]|eukprot:XP_005773655.1 hypothetical protein EMIHUDRAFT_241482 [Emiliania huxleyi CCMP1516]
MASRRRWPDEEEATRLASLLEWLQSADLYVEAVADTVAGPRGWWAAVAALEAWKAACRLRLLALQNHGSLMRAAPSGLVGVLMATGEAARARAEEEEANAFAGQQSATCPEELRHRRRLLLQLLLRPLLLGGVRSLLLRRYARRRRRNDDDTAEEGEEAPSALGRLLETLEGIDAVLPRFSAGGFG